MPLVNSGDLTPDFTPSKMKVCRLTLNGLV